MENVSNMDTQLCINNGVFFVTITDNYVSLNNNINYIKISDS